MIDDRPDSTFSSSPYVMDTQACPGNNLSLSQLTFALNEGLKHTAFSPSYVAKVHWGLAREERYADPCVASPSMRLPNSTGMPRPHRRPSVSGGTPSLTSTASRLIFSPSFPPISLPRIASVPALYVVVGGEPSFSTPHYGPGYILRGARPA